MRAHDGQWDPMYDFPRTVKINIFEARGDNTYRELLLATYGLLLGLKVGNAETLLL